MVTGEAPTALPERTGRLHRIIRAPGWRTEWEILEDVEGTVGLVLWEALSNVRLWTRVEQRSRMFRRTSREHRVRLEQASAAEPTLAAALRTFAEMVGGPASIEPRRIAEACSEVYSWAEERAALGTAAHFAEAAALVDQAAEIIDEAAAERANVAARACRRAALNSHSAIWYQRGHGLAVRVGADADEQAIRAMLGYGGLMYGLGRYDRARRFLNRASRRARSTRRTRQAAEAEHDLLAIASELRLFGAGEQHALAALRDYPMHHPRIPFLVHDVAYFFVANGLYSPAIPLVRASIRAMDRPQDPILAWGTLARAAAGAGRLDVYRRARGTALKLAGQYQEHAPATLRSIAYAAQLAGEWDVAADAAARGLKAATDRAERDVARTCRELLAHVTSRQAGLAEIEPPANNHVESLVRDCGIRLRQWNEPPRGRPVGRSKPS
jgi:hypothetical protein